MTPADRTTPNAPTAREREGACPHCGEAMQLPGGGWTCGCASALRMRAERTKGIVDMATALRSENESLRAALLAARREVEEAKKERERVRVVHLRRHQRLAAALGLDDGYSVDATIDEAIRRAATQEER